MQMGQLRWLQRQRRQKGVKLNSVQTELALMVKVMRIVFMRVGRMKPLSGHQGEQ
jgi:hypothetical protein